jgi:ubiquinone/menaquinone biosynthesis C-methylase UbiE
MNNITILTESEVNAMDYVSFMGLIHETNRPPGGKDSVRRMVLNSFLDRDSQVLHAGCNTGYCSFEIVHLAKCKITAIDINERMIATAKEEQAKEPEPYRSLLDFRLADAQKLPFAEETFDLVMSGGSTAFIKDQDAAVREYVRVCKPYGFVGDMCLFYLTKPPQELVDEINHTIQINIQIWDEEYWLSLYRRAGLEIFYRYSASMPNHPTDEDVTMYCEKMIDLAGFPTQARAAAVKKMYGYMSLFKQNHQYLGYNVLVCRKRPYPEQVTLFGA